MKLVDYKLEPAAAEQKFGFMLRMLLQSMEKRLETQPVYRLDDKIPIRPGSRRICWGWSCHRQDPPADQATVTPQLKTGALA